ncbi:stress response protein NST1 isoform X2 [Sus scrofa]|uniref:stress response protein NST1 isoform X2 n=1 Tax=Sus scrofa TaxID=9823 RepID=UPI000A2B4B5B|nr:stress response protein NST1 isoform X2 [Sus scrofa]XP_020938052.1 stress response protein NST1 isoform X2 [Sus scrofa]XP_020938053.1 stress response protein NST1 isoform X2 [Sus scrofa]XP_020938054.1 stress response protein NST1 isoform X2 [Sus scrofa]XP_020938055.1 stress response protein NST1 isoform X2 [Sus scrofa]
MRKSQGIPVSEQHQREYEETEGREKSVAERRKLFEKPQGKNDVPEKIFEIQERNVPQERNVMNKRQEEKEREEIMRKSQGIPVSEQHQREYEETEGPEKSVAERRKLFEKPQGKNDVPEKIFVPQERNVMNKRQEEKGKSHDCISLYTETWFHLLLVPFPSLPKIIVLNSNICIFYMLFCQI